VRGTRAQFVCASVHPCVGAFTCVLLCVYVMLVEGKRGWAKPIEAAGQPHADALRFAERACAAAYDVFTNMPLSMFGVHHLGRA